MKLKEVKYGMRVKIQLQKPYTEKEIREYGCDPAVDGLEANVVNIDDSIKPAIIELKFDTTVKPSTCVPEAFRYNTDVYFEYARNLVKV